MTKRTEPSKADQQERALAATMSVLIDAIADRVVEKLRASDALGHNTVPKRLYSADEAAYALGFSSRKVYQLIKRGLPTIRIGGQQRIEMEEAVAWLRVHGADE